MLRGLILAAAGLFFVGALAMVAWDPGAWPMLIASTVLLLGTAGERFYYRGSENPAAAGSWEATAERFRDERSGRLVTVWFNPATGERRYVEAGETPPAT
jgi:hypothetical protein